MIAPLRLAAVVLLAAALAAGCATGPTIRTQSAPGLQVERYRTFGFLPRLDTDTGDYSSVLSVSLKTAAAREMEARGFRAAATDPDLLINFHIDQSGPRVRSGPSIGIGIGRSWGGWHSGSSVGIGVSNSIGRSRGGGTLTVDVVDRARNELVWAGSAVGEITSEVLDDPDPTVRALVPKIFEKFPGRAGP